MKSEKKKETNIPSNRVFCAIDPETRPAWAKAMYELLKPDGELITLMYPVIILIFCVIIPFLINHILKKILHFLFIRLPIMMVDRHTK